MRDPSARLGRPSIESKTSLVLIFSGVGRQAREPIGSSNFDHVVVLRALIMNRCLVGLESDHVFRTDEPEIQPDLKKARYRKWRDFGAGLNDRDIAAKAPTRRFSHLL